jgi:N-acetylmuramoyl-L-alanine amidase
MIARRVGVGRPIQGRQPFQGRQGGAESPALRVVCSALVVLLLVPSSVIADTPDHDAYVAALARERIVRTALTNTVDRSAYLRDVRAVVTEYQAIVRRFPTSGYSDNALWHAGRLALDSYDRFGETRDRDAGVRLLQRLSAEYPTSTLVKLVAPALAAAGAVPGDSAEARPVSTAAPEKSTVATQKLSGLQAIKGITRTVLPDVVRIIVELDAEVPFHDERAANPDRVLIDLARTRTPSAAADQTVRFTGDSDVVRQIRVGAVQNRSARLALDAAGVATYSVYPLYNPYRLVIDCVRAPRTVPRRLLVSRPLLTAWGRKLPSIDPHDVALLQDARISAPAGPADRVATVTGGSGAATDPKAARSFSMARQLGLGISRIVIDPGHGGHDPGAMGQGITEAELVLDVALRLETMLLKLGGVEIVLTRRTDDFVSLQERTAIANRESADLFLSIHANASEDGQARGVETYFLNFADNLSAASVAARENAASGQTMGALPDFVKAIALNNKLDESREFATSVQRSMIERLRPANKSVKDLGVKQAPFVVLIGAAMPSVLAEISFITNPQEAKLLHGPAYRQRIADALFAAIRKYQTSLRSVGAVAAH